MDIQSPSISYLFQDKSKVQEIESHMEKTKVKFETSMDESYLDPRETRV
jgi:hypothetical protein